MRFVRIILLGAMLGGCETAAQTHQAHSTIAKGTLLLDGGGLFSREVHNRVGALLGPNAKLCAITTANRDGSYSKELFGDLPGVTVALFDIGQADAQTPEIETALDACDGYYFEGGVPDLLSRAFLTEKGKDTRALATIRRRYLAGALVAGSSAGAMIPGPLSLCECGPVSSIQALRTGNLVDAQGFALVPTPIDAHSFTYSHYGRELFAMAKFRWRRLVAVDERTAVEVPPGGAPWRVIGDGTVALITAPPNAAPDALSGFDITLMTRGDRFDPQSDAILPREGRLRIDSPHAGRFVSYSAFDEHELNHLAAMLSRGAADTVSWSRLVPSRTTLAWTPNSQTFSGAGQLITHLSLSVDRVSHEELPPEAIQAGYGAESRDWLVPAIAGPRPAGDMHTPTPTSAPGAEVLRSDELRRRLIRSDAPIMINALGAQQSGAVLSIGESVWLSGSGAVGNQGDATEQKLGRKLKALTRGDKMKPLVFYCFSSSSWLSYDAAERAIHLGYRNVAWYRGGITAWRAAGGALAPLEADSW